MGNSTSYAGGAAYSTGHNSIAYYNTGSASASSANWYGGTVSFCCVTPLAAGPGNFTNAPLFADTNGWSNLRLQSNSPCINAGRNLDAPGAVWTAVLRTNYPWQAGTMIWTEPNAGSPGAAFYRLGAGQGE